MGLILLSHSKQKRYNNPVAPDFDRFIADVHEKVWSPTARLCDAVLFGNYMTVVQEKTGQAPKGIGGTERMIYTEHRDVHDAKNRYGLPPIIKVPEKPAEVFECVWSLIKAANRESQA